MGIWKAKNQIKAKSANWNGGISPITTRIRTSPQYVKWRHQIFIRDNFTGQKCGGHKSGSLIAHHKKPFSKIIREIKKKMPLLDLFDAAMAFAEMWDINN